MCDQQTWKKFLKILLVILIIIHMFVVLYALILSVHKSGACNCVYTTGSKNKIGKNLTIKKMMGHLGAVH